MPSSMLDDALATEWIRSASVEPGFDARRCVTYSSTTPSTPRPNNIAADPAAAADNVTPATPSTPPTTTSDRIDGNGPTSTSQKLRKTTNSSGRINASEPTVFQMLSCQTTASVSRAIRCPPAK